MLAPAATVIGSPTRPVVTAAFIVTDCVPVRFTTPAVADDDDMDPVVSVEAEKPPATLNVNVPAITPAKVVL